MTNKQARDRRRSLLGRLFLIALPAVCWTAFLPSPALAQTPSVVSMRQFDHGAVITTPSDAAYSKTNDLRLTVDTRWANNHGYRPMRVRIVSRQAAKVEKRITLRVHIAGTDQPSLEVEQSFDLAQGSRELEAVVRIPKLYGDDRCWWTVWVDGTRDRELSLDESESWNVNAAGNARSLGTTLHFIVVKDESRPGRLMTTTSEPIAATTFAPADLPTHWIDYSAVDVVALTPRELSLLESSHPEAMTALRRWIRSGGQLWVHSVGQNWERLDEVEQCLELSNHPPLPRPYTAEAADLLDERDQQVTSRGWRPVLIGADSGAVAVSVQHIPSGRTRVVSDPATIARLKLDPTYEISEEPATPAADMTISDRDSTRWYVERTAGLGRVRVFRGSWDPVGFSMAWRMLGGGTPNQPPFEPVPKTPVTVAVETTRNWQARHGLTPGVANADFADFLVPDVGLAPVTEFRVLITLFVLVIGPLNYWILMRANRLHLLLLTVPALALGLTAALFGYAIISDGLGSVARVRSYTTLDQATGEAASWARLSYYAGLAPGEGLVFSGDVAVYPILSEWEQASDQNTEEGNELRWADGRQLFSKGWLRSRTPTQYVTVCARNSRARLQLRRTDDGLLAENKLGARIRYLAVVDDAGSIFTGEALESGVQVELDLSTHAEALRVLRDLLVQNQPVMPPELVVTRPKTTDQQSRRQRFFRQGLDPDFGLERLSENSMNAAIAGIVAANAEGVLNVPRRSFVAITEKGPEVELGLADLKEEASFHVLQGNW